MARSTPRYYQALERARLLRQQAQQSPRHLRVAPIHMAKCWLIIARGERVRAMVSASSRTH